MDTNEVMREAVARAGLSLRAASIAIGKSPNWLASTLQRPGSSEAATVAALGMACGHTLALVPNDDVPSSALVIDAPAAEEPGR